MNQIQDAAPFTGRARSRGFSDSKDAHSHGQNLRAVRTDPAGVARGGEGWRWGRDRRDAKAGHPVFPFAEPSEGCVTEYVTLLGAERVQDAARTIFSAADRMSSAASAMYDAGNRLSQILDEHVTRFERATEQLIAALSQNTLQPTVAAAASPTSATPPGPSVEANPVVSMDVATGPDQGESEITQASPTHPMCEFVPAVGGGAA